MAAGWRSLGRAVTRPRPLQNNRCEGMEIGMAVFRVGMIGGGYMAKLHSLSFRNLSGLLNAPDDRFELVRLADANKALATSEAARWGWGEGTEDWRAVTRDPTIDLVDVATPNDSHEEICADAFAHGKHVLCEKPLSVDAPGAARMVDAAVQSGRMHMVNFSYRNWPAVQQAKKLIDSGRLGKLVYFEGHFFQDHNGDESIPRHWRFEKARAGSGALGDVGSHIIDLARLLVGDVDSLVANQRTFIHQRPLPRDRSVLAPVDTDDFITMMVEFENGATGHIGASWSLPGYKNDVAFTIVGERGAVRFSWQNSNELQFYSADDPADVSGYRSILIGRAHPGADLFWYPDLGGKQGLGTTAQGIGYGEAFALSFRQLLSSLKSGESPAPNFVDGLRCCEILDAALRSAASRAWVKVERLR